MKLLRGFAIKAAGCSAALFALGAAPKAWAADLAAAPTAGAASPTWEFQITAYGWATGLTGTVGVRNLPPVGVNLSPLDVLGNLNGALMGSFSAKNGQWLLLGDLMWAKLGDDAIVKPAAPAPIVPILPGTRINLDLRQVMASAIVGYRLPIGGPELELYATAGVRYQQLSAQATAAPGLIPAVFSRDGGVNWADPIVGIAAHWKVSNRWFVNVIADAGGFGVASNFTAQGLLAVGYNWTPSVSTALGYRAIYTDYHRNGFRYDVTQHGMFSSIAYRF
jgi:hypothetical protein